MLGLGAYGLWDARARGDGGHGGHATDGHATNDGTRYGALDDPERGDGVKRALFRDPELYGDECTEKDSGLRIGEGHEGHEGAA